MGGLMNNGNQNKLKEYIAEIENQMLTYRK